MVIRSGDFGLKPDPNFSDDEKLYRRIKQDQIYDGNRVLGNALDDIQEKHSSCSFNRGKYSDPKDVLDSNYPEHNRVAALLAGNLPEPQPHPSDAKILYAFRLEHLPKDSNYSHSEAQVTKQGLTATKLGSADFRRQLREALADKMSVLDPSEHQ